MMIRYVAAAAFLLLAACADGMVSTEPVAEDVRGLDEYFRSIQRAGY